MTTAITPSFVPVPVPRPTRLRPVILATEPDPQPSHLDVAMRAFGVTDDTMLPPDCPTPASVAALVQATLAGFLAGRGPVQRLGMLQEFLPTKPVAGSTRTPATGMLCAVAFVCHDTGDAVAVRFRAGRDQGPAGWTLDGIAIGTLRALRDAPVASLVPHGPCTTALRGRMPHAPIEQIPVQPDAVMRAKLDVRCLLAATVDAAKAADRTDVEARMASGDATPLVVASDGSVHRTRRHGPACAAWVGPYGGGGVHVLSTEETILHAELAGIHGALSWVRHHYREHGPGVVVLTDSRDAIRTIAAARERGYASAGPGPTGYWVRRVLEEIDTFDTQIRLEHVHGHRGHPLNEAANSIARTARMQLTGAAGVRRGVRRFTAQEHEIAKRWAAQYTDPDQTQP